MDNHVYKSVQMMMTNTLHESIVLSSDLVYGSRFPVVNFPNYGV